MQNSSTKLLLWSSVVVIPLSVITLMIYSSPSADKKMNEKKENVVRVYTVSNEKAEQTKELQGVVKAKKDAVLSAYHQTKVENIYFNVGEVVKKNDVLIRLDRRQADLEVHNIAEKIKELSTQIKLKQRLVTQAEEAYTKQLVIENLAKNKLERHKKLHKSKALPASQFDDTKKAYEIEKIASMRVSHSKETLENEIEVLKSTLEQRRIMYKKMTIAAERSIIVAPFDAKIIQIYVDEGEDVSIGTKLVRLLDVSAWEVEAFVPTSFAENITKRLSQKETLSAWIKMPNQTIDLTPLNIVPHPTYPDLGLMLHLSVSQPSNIKQLQHQQAVSIYISQPALDAYAIPPAALVLSKHVYIVNEDNIIKRVDVDIIGMSPVNNELWPLVKSDDITPGVRIVLDNMQTRLANTKVVTVQEAYE